MQPKSKKSIIAKNKALASPVKKRELLNEFHLENHLLKKLFANMRNHMKQRNHAEHDIQLVINYAKQHIDKQNILLIYGAPMQIILQCLGDNNLPALYKNQISYKSPYIKNHPHR